MYLIISGNLPDRFDAHQRFQSNLGFEGTRVPLALSSFAHGSAVLSSPAEPEKSNLGYCPKFGVHFSPAKSIPSQLDKNNIMSKPNPDTPVEKHKIRNHSVEIHKHGETQELWIDGVRRKFARTTRGYTLDDHAYVPPTKTLLEAVERYLALRDSKQKHSDQV
jgi:hypothetical protein